MFKAEFVFPRILLPFIMGISLFYFYQKPALVSILLIFCLLSFLSLLINNLLYKRKNAYRFKGASGISIYLLFFAFGGLLCLLNSEKLNTDYFAKKDYTYVKVWINDEPEQKNDILRLKTRVISGYSNSKQIKLSGQLLLALKLDSLNPIKLKYGDELIISAKYLAVEPPYNPGEFNFKSWLASQNIYEQTFINQNHLIKTNKNIGNPIIRFALNLREQQIAKYRRIIKNDEAFAVASTLVLGYRADLSKETLASYSKTGTIHALSVSGSHVAIILFFLNFCLAFLDRNRHLRIFKFVIVCSLIWLFALITGLSPSVVRAAIMITIFITAKTFAKNTNSYNILAFAAFCQLIYNPFLIMNVGFQLSYISVFGLIYIQPKIYKWIYVKNKLLNKVWELVALSLAAQLVTFPLCIYYFHQFPVYFLLGNLFISIPLLFIMILGLVVLLPWTDYLYPIVEWIIVFTNAVLKWISNLPYATFSSVWISVFELILLVLALGLFVYALAKYKKRFLIASLSVYFIYQSLVVFGDWKLLNQQKLIFFTLRKNYAAAFIKGSKVILLTNLKVDDKNYQFFVQPALEKYQANRIEFISLKKDTILKDFIKRRHQIIFNNYRILLIDSLLDYKKIKTTGNFSTLWLTGNNRFKLENIPPGVTYKSVIIDATNKDYKIDEFKQFMINKKVEVHILKKNPAYLVHLTQ